MLKSLAASTALALAACTPATEAETTGNDPARVVAAMFDAFNRHDAQAMAALYSEDALLASPDYCTPRRGPAQIAPVYQALFDTFPDIRDDVTEQVVEGDHLAVRFVSRSSTPGREFELPIATFIEVRDGKIVRDESIFDTQGRPCQP